MTTTGTVCILGVDVTPPTELPAGLDDLIGGLDTFTRLADFRPVIDRLFGRGTFHRWRTNGLTLDMVPVLVEWAVAHAQGDPISYADAAARVETRRAAPDADAPAPAREGLLQRAYALVAAALAGDQDGAGTLLEGLTLADCQCLAYGLAVALAGELQHRGPRHVVLAAVRSALLADHPDARRAEPWR